MKLIVGILLVLSVLMILIFMQPKRKRQRNAKIYSLVVVLYLAVQMSFIIFYFQDTYTFDKSLSEINNMIIELEVKRSDLENEIKEIEKTNDASQTYESTILHKEELRVIEEDLQKLMNEWAYREKINKVIRRGEK